MAYLGPAEDSVVASGSGETEAPALSNDARSEEAPSVEPAHAQDGDAPAPVSPDPEATPENPAEPEAPAPEDDKALSKGFAALARSQRKAREWEDGVKRRVDAQISELETRTRDLDARETRVAEREQRAGRWEEIGARAKAGDFQPFFTLAEEHGVTPEVAWAWVQSAPSPSDRATRDEIATLRRQIEERDRRDAEQAERARRERKDAEDRQAQQRLLSVGADSVKYPDLNELYEPHEIYQRGIHEMKALIAPHGYTLDDLPKFPDHEVMAVFEKALEHANAKARAKRVANGDATQRNGLGAPANKPTTARTLTSSITAEKASAPPPVSDEDLEESWKEQLKAAKRADAARD